MSVDSALSLFVFTRFSYLSSNNLVDLVYWSEISECVQFISKGIIIVRIIRLNEILMC